MKQKHYDFTEKQLEKYKHKVIGNNIILVLGTLMEEFKMTDEQLCDFMNRYEAYADGIDRGWVNPKFITEAIKSTTGLEVEWNADL